MSLDEWEADRQERRRPSSGARTSWAARHPVHRGPHRPDGYQVPAGTSAQELQAPRRGNRWERSYLTLVVVSDVVVAAAGAGVTGASIGYPPIAVAAVSLLGAAAWVVVLTVYGGYHMRRLGAGPDEFQAVLRTTFTLMAVLGLTAYAMQAPVARSWVFLTVPVTALLLSGSRYQLRRLLHRHRRMGRSMMRTLLVGTRDEVRPVRDDLEREFFHGYQVVGFCGPSLEELRAAGVADFPVLGSVSDIPQVVHEHDVDVVIVTGGALTGSALRRLSWALERTGADLVVAPGLVEVTGPYVRLRPTAGLSLVHLERPSENIGRGLAKAALDRTLGLLLLVVAAVPILVAAAAVVATSPGGPFFRQTRAGLHGRPFTMWKLRSMVVDAEERQADLAGANDRDGLMFKIRRDPRVTPVGRVLRRYSVDELPQLWNVVRGDMSLVGPRPPLLSESEKYHDAVNRRLTMKPGLTGLWQVSGRADLDWDQSVGLDLRYVDNWSVAMDVMILWKTLRVVVRGSGAY